VASSRLATSPKAGSAGGHIRLKPKSSIYSPGETAEIEIDMDWSNVDSEKVQGLLTLHRKGLWVSHRFSLRRSDPVARFPVTSYLSPEVELRVTVIGPRFHGSAVTPLAVVAPEKNIDLRVEAPRRVESSQPLCMEIETRSHSRRPIPSISSVLISKKPSPKPADISQGGSRPALLVGTDEQGKGSICMEAPRLAGKYLVYVLAAPRPGAGKEVASEKLPLRVLAGPEYKLEGPKRAAKGDVICAKLLVDARRRQASNLALRWDLRGGRRLWSWKRVLSVNATQPLARTLCWQAGQGDASALSVELDTGKVRVSDTLVVDLRPRHPVQRQISVGSHDGPLVVRARSPLAGLRVSFGSSKRVWVAEALRQILASEPFDLEGRLSVLLSLASTKEAGFEHAAAELPAPWRKKRRHEVMALAADRLLDLAGSDGLFRLHPAGPPAPPHLQSMAAYSLIRARRQGVEIGAAEWKPIMAQLLRRAAATQTAKWISAAWVLTGLGLRPEGGKGCALARHRGLSLRQLAQLLTVCHRSEARVAELDHLLGRIREALATSTTTAAEQGRRSAETPPPATGHAFALMVLDEALPGHRLAKKVAKILEAAMTDGAWRTPLSSALACCALSSHFERHPGHPPADRVVVKVGRQTIADQQIPKRSDEVFSFDLPARALSPGSRSIELVPTPDGRLYRAVQASVSISSKSPFAGAGVSIERVFGSDPQPQRSHHVFTLGEKAEIRNRVTFKKAMRRVCVRDPLPAGVELVRVFAPNWRGRAASTVDPTDPTTGSGGVTTCMVNLEAGTYELAYVVKAKHPGSYLHPPTIVHTWRGRQSPLATTTSSTFHILKEPVLPMSSFVESVAKRRSAPDR
jgi:uncharacterized protein YfaS (alpha-2-macroglobulin family)